LFTAFGAVLYVDAASGLLRHGPVETVAGKKINPTARQSGPCRIQHSEYRQGEKAVA